MPNIEDALLEQIKEKFINDLLECFEEVFEEVDAYDIYADIKDKDAVIAELVELIKGE